MKKDRSFFYTLSTFCVKEEHVFLRESNAIEGVYDELSLEQAKRAWVYLTNHKSLTEKRILITHKILMDGKLPPAQCGAWRTCDVWIGGRQGARWQSVPHLMSEWIKKANKIRISEIRSSHVEFEHIHPFIDGNGRMGRILMNWQRKMYGLNLEIIYEDKKHEYYKWFQEN